MFITLYQAYENPSISGYTSELHLLFNRALPSRVQITQERGNTLEKALNKIGREDIVKKCIFNVELVTDDVEKAVARVRLDQPGFDSLKEELGPSRDSSLRRDGTLASQKHDYDEPDRMKDSESVEDLSNLGNVQQKHTKQQHITITNGTVFNGTSTPIKDKYASEEKDLGDDMAEFLEHKYYVTDTMTKKSRDEVDDDRKNRQRVIEDANKLVTDITEEAAKRAQLLAEQALAAGKPESDFLQHSEPSYMETTTTEIDPLTNERITRTTRVITSSTTVPGTEEMVGNDELRESMQKVVDQFMTEERRAQ